MKILLISSFAAILAIAPFAAPAQAGCLKGALVGGIAGHIIGHGYVGAAAGCAYGSHKSRADRGYRNEGARPLPDDYRRR